MPREVRRCPCTMRLEQTENSRSASNRSSRPSGSRCTKRRKPRRPYLAADLLTIYLTTFYYDLSHGHFSPSLFQLVAFSRISDHRLRDWLRVFGFDIEAIPRLQIQFRSKRTVLLESSVDDPNSSI